MALKNKLSLLCLSIIATNFGMDNTSAAMKSALNYDGNSNVKQIGYTNLPGSYIDNNIQNSSLGNYGNYNGNNYTSFDNNNYIFNSKNNLKNINNFYANTGMNYGYNNLYGNNIDYQNNNILSSNDKFGNNYYPKVSINNDDNMAGYETDDSMKQGNLWYQSDFDDAFSGNDDYIMYGNYNNNENKYPYNFSNKSTDELLICKSLFKNLGNNVLDQLQQNDLNGAFSSLVNDVIRNYLPAFVAVFGKKYKPELVNLFRDALYTFGLDVNLNIFDEQRLISSSDMPSKEMGFVVSNLMQYFKNYQNNNSKSMFMPDLSKLAQCILNSNLLDNVVIKILLYGFINTISEDQAIDLFNLIRKGSENLFASKDNTSHRNNVILFMSALLSKELISCNASQIDSDSQYNLGIMYRMNYLFPKLKTECAFDTNIIHTMSDYYAKILSSVMGNYSSNPLEDESGPVPTVMYLVNQLCQNERSNGKQDYNEILYKILTGDDGYNLKNIAELAVCNYSEYNGISALYLPEQYHGKRDNVTAKSANSIVRMIKFLRDMRDETINGKIDSFLKQISGYLSTNFYSMNNDIVSGSELEILQCLTSNNPGVQKIMVEFQKFLSQFGYGRKLVKFYNDVSGDNIINIRNATPLSLSLLINHLSSYQSSTKKMDKADWYQYLQACECDAAYYQASANIVLRNNVLKILRAINDVVAQQETNEKYFYFNQKNCITILENIVDNLFYDISGLDDQAIANQQAINTKIKELFGSLQKSDLYYILQFIMKRGVSGSLTSYDLLSALDKPLQTIIMNNHNKFPIDAYTQKVKTMNITSEQKNELLEQIESVRRGVKNLDPNVMPVASVFPILLLNTRHAPLYDNNKNVVSKFLEYLFLMGKCCISIQRTTDQPPKLHNITRVLDFFYTQVTGKQRNDVPTDCEAENIIEDFQKQNELYGRLLYLLDSSVDTLPLKGKFSFINNKDIPYINIALQNVMRKYPLFALITNQAIVSNQDNYREFVDDTFTGNDSILDFISSKLDPNNEYQKNFYKLAMEKYINDKKFYGFANDYISVLLQAIYEKLLSVPNKDNWKFKELFFELNKHKHAIISICANTLQQLSHKGNLKNFLGLFVENGLGAFFIMEEILAMRGGNNLFTNTLVSSKEQTNASIKAYIFHNLIAGDFTYTYEQNSNRFEDFVKSLTEFTLAEMRNRGNMDEDNTSVASFAMKPYKDHIDDISSIVSDSYSTVAGENVLNKSNLNFNYLRNNLYDSRYYTYK